MRATGLSDRPKFLKARNRVYDNLRKASMRG